MRIVKGKWKGRQFRVTSLPATVRPTSNAAKEGIINIMEHSFSIEGKTVLDLFAGTGGIGFEFLSNRAARVTMVEQSPRLYSFIQQTAMTLDISKEYLRIYCRNVFRFFEGLEEGQQFDIIFADPPFKDNFFDKIVSHILMKEILAPDGIFIYESTNLTKEKKGRSNDTKLKPIKIATYGDIRFSIYDKQSLET